MEIRYLLKSEEKMTCQFYGKAWTFLPFIATLSQSLVQTIRQLRKQEYTDTLVSKREGRQVIGFFNGKILEMLASVEKQEEKLLVSSVLLNKEVDISRTDFIEALEKLTKTANKDVLEIVLLSEISPEHQEWFEQLGFEKDGLNYFKAIPRVWGIALGGGGARGSYAIGIWEYFDEQKRKFDVITGTSIGASTAALMATNSLEAAKNMWEEIDTSQILDFEMDDSQAENSMGAMVSTIAGMALNSIAHIGISSDPIYQLIDKYYDIEALKQTQVKIGIVTVEAPLMNEVDVELHTKPEEEWIDWLIASGSFFPAMQAKEINGKYYIDGGYRNNVPVDFARDLGANHIAVIDVSGPGFWKTVQIPEEVSTWNFKSPWKLGAILIFDGSRSVLNMRLGYLEARKVFEEVFGYWFTFEETDFESRLHGFYQEFLLYVKKKYHQEALSENFLSRLSRLHKKEVSKEEIPLAMLETLGRFADISPFERYNINGFCHQIIKKIDNSFIDTDEFLSITEWFSKYYQEFVVLSDFQIFQHIRGWLNSNDKEEKRRRIEFLWSKLPAFVLIVLLHEFIEQGEEGF